MRSLHACPRTGEAWPSACALAIDARAAIDPADRRELVKTGGSSEFLIPQDIWGT